MDAFTNILVIEHLSPDHNGNYTCNARNPAAEVHHTQRLIVNGKRVLFLLSSYFVLILSLSLLFFQFLLLLSPSLSHRTDLRKECEQELFAVWVMATLRLRYRGSRMAYPFQPSWALTFPPLILFPVYLVSPIYPLLIRATTLASPPTQPLKSDIRLIFRWKVTTLCSKNEKSDLEKFSWCSDALAPQHTLLSKVFGMHLLESPLFSHHKVKFCIGTYLFVS